MKPEVTGASYPDVTLDSAGRYCVLLDSYPLVLLFDNQVKWIAGWHAEFLVTGVDTNIYSLKSGANEQCSLWLLATGQLEARCGATVIATSTERIVGETSNYIEAHVEIHDTTGVFTVWVNNGENAWISVPTGDTKNYTGATGADRLVFDTEPIVWLLRDLYVLDGTATDGATYQSRLGPQAVETLLATANGANQALTALPEPAWSSVEDENGPDFVGTYIYKTSSGASTFAHGALPEDVEVVNGLRVNNIAYATGVASPTVHTLLDTNVGDTYDCPADAAWHGISKHYALNPTGVTPWTPAAANATVIGTGLA